MSVSVAANDLPPYRSPALRRIRTVFIILLMVVVGLSTATAANRLPTPKPYIFSKSYSWQEPNATVMASGNLQWAPRTFVFEKGASLRYIDFEGGSDSNDGLSKDAAWQHHPWDAAATDNARACKGLHTYIFKGGVEYKGTLVVKESGSFDDPIRLTREPGWGEGAPVFSGATTIKGGWLQGDARNAPGIPEPDKVWFIDLGADYDTDTGTSSFTSIWQVAGGQVERLHIARSPNYDRNDPNRPYKNWANFKKIEVTTKTFYSPVIAELKGTSEEELKDVSIRATSPSLMGGAYPRDVSKARWDLAKGAISTEAFGDSNAWSKMARWNKFMIENAAVLLDTDGEYFFSRKGPYAGRLYLRPAHGIDPNTATYKVSQRHVFVTMEDKSNIVISGLEFRYNDQDDNTPNDSTRHNGKPAPCIMAIGSCSNIVVKNNRFINVADVIEVRLRRVGRGGSKGQVIDQISITDNDVQHASGAGVIAILGPDAHRIHPQEQQYGRIKHVEVKRNRINDTGFRGATRRWDSMPAISILYPETCEIAGNIISNTMGIGIITYGGKASGHLKREAPLIRYLVHHNQLERTMLEANDYGGLEHFQGGPAYIYNNVSRNTNGNRSFWGHMLGYNLYLDGGFKCYSFNNILAGDSRPDEADFYNHCGYFMVFGFMDQFFNNTLYRFENGIDGSSGNRSNILGNLISDCQNAFIRQNRSGDHSMMGGGDTGEMGRLGIPTMAYDSNVFYGNPKEFGEVAGTAQPGQGKAPVVKGSNIKKLRKALEANKSRLSDMGVHVEQQPMKDPAGKDYRPTIAPSTEGHGVKYFVPWALARTVGEWNFYKSESMPELVLGEHFYMTDEYGSRRNYYHLPRMDLSVSNCTSRDYLAGELEDWIDGALAFDGSRTAVLTHAEMKKNMSYPQGKGKPYRSYNGAGRETVDMDSNDFLIEIVFRTEAAGGSLVAKRDGTNGYEVAVTGEGAIKLSLLAGGAETMFSTDVRINDGAWHHVVIEVDRLAAGVVLYVDGQVSGKDTLKLDKEVTLSNGADFVIGKDFVGAIDFLRIARSTLTESQTEIDELYTWEFDGPHLRDFTGEKQKTIRSAGALSGR